ncbi:MAG: tetratricopeptide repeat protein [Planctomycetota bacterium]
MKRQFEHLWRIAKLAFAKQSDVENNKTKKVLATIMASTLTATVVVASTIHFADKSDQLFRSSRISDAQIATDPDRAIQKAHEKLREFGQWRTNPIIKTKHTDEITHALLVIAKAKEVKSFPSDVVKNYYELIEQFPDSSRRIEVLCKIVSLDKEKGMEYAIKFLERSGDVNDAILFYSRLIRNYLSPSESDFLSTKKCVNLFMDKYGFTENGVKLMAQLTSSIGRVSEQERLNKIIESKVVEDPNSDICCAYFRQRALSLYKTKDFAKALEIAVSVRRKFPKTKLATCLAAITADDCYQKENYVVALKEFEEDLFSKGKSETVIVEDIDGILELYTASVLRRQSIDRGRIYESLAKHAESLGLSTTAVHCYRQSAKVKGSYIDVFERAAQKNTKYCNTNPENEIWFWKGMSATEESNLTVAVMMYERFLKTDSKSILAAVAYYNSACAKTSLGQHVEAKEAITKAELISPCRPVIELIEELAKTKIINP